MQGRKVKSLPLWVWVVSGLSAPLAQSAARSHWLGVLILGTLCSIVCCLVIQIVGKHELEVPLYCILQTIWLVILTGEVAQWSEDCWPTGADFPIVPLTLLVLAVFSAWDGADRASRSGSVLFWFLALLYAIILGAGVQNLKAENMHPVLDTPEFTVVVLLLLPVAVTFLPGEKGGGKYLVFGLTIFSAIISLWTVGTLSSNVVKDFSQPFYEYSRSLSLFGVVERFEAFVSVALTMSYFALLSFLLSAVGHLTENTLPGKGRAGVALAASVAAVILLFVPEIPVLYLAGAAVILWVFLPIVTTRVTSLKKSEKNEKST